ncbi:sugar phosphate isomerase/epimerase [Candidatus Poribacteria bacterium]|nr:sugar phosphate isomerase/epimerase [Candidatus Poribacteria bacterium]
MKIAMHQITSIRASFEEDMRAYAEAGWTAFEMHLHKASQHIEKHGMEHFVRLVKDSGLSPIAATGHVVVAFGTDEELAANEAQLSQALDIMAAVSCPAIVFGGDAPKSVAPAPNQSEAGLSERDHAYRAQLARFANRVGKLADLAKTKGVTMALEVNWCGMCRSISTAAEAVELANRQNVGLLFDTAHFACTPSRLSDLDRLSGRIVAGHLNDMRDCPPEVRNVNNDRVIPGDGVLPLREWLDKVGECGFDGWHSVELFSEDLWGEDVLTIARKVKEGCQRVWPEAQF